MHHLHGYDYGTGIVAMLLWLLIWGVLIYALCAAFGHRSYWGNRNQCDDSQRNCYRRNGAPRVVHHHHYHKDGDATPTFDAPAPVQDDAAQA